MNNDLSQPQTIRDKVESVLRSESASIKQLAENLPANCETAVRVLLECSGRVIVTGMGKMSAVARKSAATLSSVGTPAVFLHPSEALHGDLGIVTKHDAMLALSNSGQTQDVLDLLPYLKRHAVPIISITGGSENALAQASDVNLPTGVSSEADSLTAAPTNSTTTTLALCDAIAITLAHQRGFTSQQFAANHPGGKIGKQLLMTVGDLMLSGEDLPLVPETCLVRRAIVTISEGKVGACFVVDADKRLLGIVTDGDLRRILQRSENPLDQTVKGLMTVNPVTAANQLLAVDALNLMNSKAITVLPVVDGEGQVAGALHLHAILNEGIG